MSDLELTLAAGRYAITEALLDPLGSPFAPSQLLSGKIEEPAAQP